MSQATGSVVQRLLDVVLAALALLVLSPVLLAVYLGVRLTSAGGGLYRQTRIGQHGRPFSMLKFRTMRTGCSHEAHQDYVRRLLAGEVTPSGGLFKLDADARVTRLGRFLRRTSIDELPQLVNVLRGEMSLVGPRPALDWEVELFPDWAMARFSVRPGLTGLWQVSGRNRLTMTEGLELDAQYVRLGGTRRYLGILLRTIPAMLDGGAR
jgi:lipopolysaccharide/colanic/teichoic acid biosynthesis glycosyltransferase